MSQEQGAPLEANDLLIILFFGVIVLAILAIVLHDPVVRAIVVFNYHLLTWIDAVWDFEVVKASIAALKSVKSIEELTWGDAWDLSTLTGEYLRWVVVPLLAGLGTWLVLADPIRRHRSVKTMQALVRDKAKAFPVIRPVVGLNLLDAKHYRDNWRPMLNPFEWAIEHQVILEEERDDKGQVVGKKPATMAVRRERKLNPDQFKAGRFSFDEARVRQLFEGQLGPLINPTGEAPQTMEDVWAMIQGLPPHYRALIALMLMRYVGGRAWRDRSHDLIEQLANSYYVDPAKERDQAESRLKKKLGAWGLVFLVPWLSKGMVWLKKRPEFTVENLDVSGVDDIIKALLFLDDEEVRARVMLVFGRRAWAHTLMIDLLERAREYGGILITADFIWLKPVDRLLFYVMNSTGRKAFQVESAGAFAQYYTEDVMQRPFPTPEVDTAVEALKKILIKEGWLPDPNEAASSGLDGRRVRIPE